MLTRQQSVGKSGKVKVRDSEQTGADTLNAGDLAHADIFLTLKSSTTGLDFTVISEAFE
ncbi:hypothetical protein [Serratia aquatilis]|uniref:Uncharacterized protein n=1 Tax=Serratia aquatilis TaxID=1737515 RepID=A0ABV6EHH5_9GAMM